MKNTIMIDNALYKIIYNRLPWVERVLLIDCWKEKYVLISEYVEAANDL